jgi:hypothetical protein
MNFANKMDCTPARTARCSTSALKCRLKILSLRKEDAGRVYRGGDLDNRLKTLFGALSVLRKEQVVEDDTIDDQICCLPEDDAPITAGNVEAHR